MAGAGDLYLGEVSKADWPKVHKKIHRSKGDYWKIWMDGVFLVCATAPFHNAASTTHLEASDRMEAAVDTFKLCDGVNPISTSHAWVPEKSPASEWKVVKHLDDTIMQADTESFRQACQEYEVPISPKSQDGFLKAESNRLPLSTQLELCRRAVELSRKSWWQKTSYIPEAIQYRTLDNPDKPYRMRSTEVEADYRFEPWLDSSL